MSNPAKSPEPELPTEPTVLVHQPPPGAPPSAGPDVGTRRLIYVPRDGDRGPLLVVEVLGTDTMGGPAWIVDVVSDVGAANDLVMRLWRQFAGPARAGEELAPKQCPVCKWSNTGILNYGHHQEKHGGRPGDAIWLCHGCAARAITPALALALALIRQLRDGERRSLTEEEAAVVDALRPLTRNLVSEKCPACGGGIAINGCRHPWHAAVPA